MAENKETRQDIIYDQSSEDFTALDLPSSMLTIHDLVHEEHRPLKTKENALLLVMLALALFLWFRAGYKILDYQGFNVNRRHSGKLEITIIDVKQGDSALLEMPGGEVVLIDGGDGTYPGDPYQEANAGELYVDAVLRQKNITRIDYVILTHPHADHLGGLNYILTYYNVKKVLDPGLKYANSIYEYFLKIIDARNIEYDNIKSGDVFKFKKGVFMQVLHPLDLSRYDTSFSGVNNNSAVIRLLYGKTSFLFTGDVEKEGEQELLKYGGALKSPVIKVPPHGSRTSSTEELIAAVSPEYAAISLGMENSFGHPSEEVLSRYEAAGSRILRTDWNGDILFVSDGETVSCKLSR